MAFVYEIQCVETTKGRKPHERINAVGGMYDDGTPWIMPVRDAIACIERGMSRFYVTIGGVPAWVVVATSKDDVKYLKTELDDEQPNLLLKLPSDVRRHAAARRPRGVPENRDKA